ncbi:MAG: flagellar hook-associated protein 3 [Proteobacteria bacterium]|nr:flagellar hook-associated protein 3 [Pseudomonadota bacterium]
MQISTQQFFDRSLRNMQEIQSDAANTNEQLSTGKALIRPSDDTNKLRTIGNLERAIDKVQSYNNNVDHLINRYSTEEGALTSASSILIRTRELAIQASNATMSSEDRKIVAIEVDGLQAELLALANSKDVTGQALFAGAKTSVEPYVVDDNGDVIYQGDTRQTMIEVSENRQLPKNRSGVEIFTGVTRLDEKGEEERISFFAVLNDFKESLLAEQKTQVQVAPTELSAVSGELTINGVQISQIEDQPTLAELVTLINAETPRTNVLATVDDEGNLLWENASGHETDSMVFGATPGLLSTVSGTVTPSVDSRLMERSITEVGDLHDNISVALGRIGSEVQNAENQQDINLDNEVRLKQFKSSEVDVDFAEAVSRFNAELARLEAAQASFAKLSQLSLFEYI